MYQTQTRYTHTYPFLPSSSLSRSVGVSALSKAVGHRLHPVPMFGSGGDRADHHVRMAHDIFGAGEDRDVDAMRQRREIERRRPGIVDQRDDAARAGDGGDRRDILHLERQGTGGFEEDGP